MKKIVLAALTALSCGGNNAPQDFVSENIKPHPETRSIGQEPNSSDKTSLEEFLDNEQINENHNENLLVFYDSVQGSYCNGLIISRTKFISGVSKSEFMENAPRGCSICKKKITILQPKQPNEHCRCRCFIYVCT